MFTFVKSFCCDKNLGLIIHTLCAIALYTRASREQNEKVLKDMRELGLEPEPDARRAVSSHGPWYVAEWLVCDKKQRAWPEPQYDAAHPLERALRRCDWRALQDFPGVYVLITVQCWFAPSCLPPPVSVVSQGTLDSTILPLCPPNVTIILWPFGL